MSLYSVIEWCLNGAGLYLVSEEVSELVSELVSEILSELVSELLVGWYMCKDYILIRT